jgi:hypothetical protein
MREVIESRRPWLRSARFDTALILLPPFAVTLLVMCVPSIFQTDARSIPSWAWIVFVLLIDVAHVYGTLFRTYFAGRNERNKLGPVLYLVPLACWLGGVMLYSTGSANFWRALAYVAVFHFIRQAYGFMRIYSRGDQLASWERRCCAFAIYAATIYPLLYWHLHLPRRFSWFADGDFFDFSRFLSLRSSAALERSAFGIYVAVLCVFTFIELRRWWRGGGLNFARVAIVGGNALSWYVGIVVYDGDLAFTATNVVAHGLPYMGLTWAYWQSDSSPKTTPHVWSRAWTLAAFAFTLVGFAYLEEGLWDGLVWQEHPRLFAWATPFPFVTGTATLTWLVPLLALPQSTHYVLDAFVWKLRNRGSEWQSRLSKFTTHSHSTRLPLSEVSSSSTTRAAIREA